MKYFRIGLLITFITSLTFCQSRYFLDFSKITFEKARLKKIYDTDSLQLNFTVKIPPKSVEKKGVAVILPMIINESDTIKFKTLTLAGEGNWDDCMNIPYKYQTIREYGCSEKAFSSNFLQTSIHFRILTAKKDKILQQKFHSIAIDSIQTYSD